MGTIENEHDLSFEELCEAVAPIAEKYEVNRIYLFGSRARGENKGGSDYDFYVVLGSVKNLIKICGLLRELEETLGEKVDIITDGAQLTEDFAQKIFAKEGWSMDFNMRSLESILQYCHNIEEAVQMFGSNEKDFLNNIQFQQSCAFPLLQRGIYVQSRRCINA